MDENQAFLSAANLSGLDQTINRTVEATNEIVDQLDTEYENFDSNKFWISSSYVFGSVAAGTGVIGESDLDICLCVPESENDETIEQCEISHLELREEIATRVENKQEWILEPIGEDLVSRLDVWIAEPAYNALHIRETVSAPIYMVETGELEGEKAAEKIMADQENTNPDQ